LSGAFAFGGKEEHKARLEAEGVVIEDYSVDLEEYRW
jgi:alkylated DNA nucleotide flippase Atl1